MLKKTLIATAAISATLLAAATLLPALAQSRSTASAGTAAITAQAPFAPGSADRRSAADDNKGRTSANQSERDDRHEDEDRIGSHRKSKEEGKPKSRD